MQITYSTAQLKKALEDPASFGTIECAVALLPCVHKVDLVSARALYGKEVEGSWEVQPFLERICIVCKKRITGYTVDHTFNSLINIKKCKTPPKLHNHPGKPTKFKHKIIDYDLPMTFLHYSKLKETLSFYSPDEEAAISSFALHGHYDTGVVLSISVQEPLFQAFKIYLAAHNIQPGIRPFTFSSQNTEQLAVLYKILSENNVLPESHKVLIDQIVKEAYEPPPYPGKNSTFILNKEWSYWDNPISGTATQRQMVFVPWGDSSLKRIWILGQFNGQIRIRIDPQFLYASTWERYLKSQGIPLNVKPFAESILISDHKQQKKLFTILVRNNTFDIKDQIKFREIIEIGSIPTTEKLFGYHPLDLGGIVN